MSENPSLEQRTILLDNQLRKHRKLSREQVLQLAKDHDLPTKIVYERWSARYEATPDHARKRKRQDTKRAWSSLIGSSPSGVPKRHEVQPYQSCLNLLVTIVGVGLLIGAAIVVLSLIF
jgi:hypothetical protein